MDMDDDFDFVNPNNSLNDHQKDNFDFPIHHSTPSISHTKSSIRPIDFPSLQKYYGIVTLCGYELPIIYRLINDTFYIPYIRFSFVLNIFEHCSYKKHLLNIRNLPVIEMTNVEKEYYNELSALNNSSDWSNYQLLSVSILDGILATIKLLQNNLSSNEQCKEWQEAFNVIRQQARDRWILDEKIVCNRVKENKENSLKCLSSTNMAKRRSFFEQRLDLSILTEAGGFIQIDSYIYPFVTNPINNEIYINLHDIKRNYTLSSTSMIYYCDEDSSMYRAYIALTEQAQLNNDWNIIRRGRNNDLSKYLPTGKRMKDYFFDELPFIPLHIFLKSNSTLNFRFVQLFETPSLDEIELSYKNNVGQQFILTTKRQGGLINDSIPCLIYPQIPNETIWIPSDIKTKRLMNNDERLYLNIILLYHGYWKNLLTKKKQWYLKEYHDKENSNIEIFFDNDKARRNKIV